MIDTFHVTGKFSNDEWAVGDVWKIFSEYFKNEKKMSLSLRALVILPNHYHLLIQSFDSLSSGLSSDVKKERWLCDLKNQWVFYFGVEFINSWFAKPIENFAYYMQAYRYIYRNPVEARIVKRVEDYRFSTLQQILGGSPYEIPVVDDLHLIQDPQRRLRWLNTPQNLFYKSYFEKLEEIS